MEVEDAPSRSRILIVEDEGIIAHSIGQIVQNLGYTLFGIAASAQEAFTLACQTAEPVPSAPVPSDLPFPHLLTPESVTPDLILMDISIKGDIDGIELAQIWRARFETPVVFMTAHTDAATLARMGEAQPAGFIVKPFRVSKIRTAVELALHGARQRLRLLDKERNLNALLEASLHALIATDTIESPLSLNEPAELWTETTFNSLSRSPIEDVLQFARKDAASAAELYLKTRDLNHRVPKFPPGSEPIPRDRDRLKRITADLESAQAAAARIAEDISRMRYALNHDLPEPIRTVSLMCQLILRNLGDHADGRIADAVSHVVEACAQIDNHLHRIRDVEQVAAPILPLNR